MHPTNCLNCTTMVTADDRFCPTCGQKTDTHRLNMSHIWHDIGHALTHTDKGFFYTIKELAIRPGIVAREYASGKRKKYFNPFSFLFIIVGVYLIANSIFKPYSADFNSTPVPATMKTESQKKKFAIIQQRRYNMGEFMNKHTNVVIFISTPFIAFVLWLLFRRRGLYYAENLAAMAYVNGFLALLTIVVFGPLLFFTKGSAVHMPIYISMMLTHVLYLGFMYHGFARYTRPRDYWKTMGAGVVGILAWAILSGGIGVIYIMSGLF